MDESQFKEGLPPIPKNMGPIAGPMYLGILLNWWLFGVLTLQYYLYYLNFPKDIRFIKWIVHFLFALELVQTMFTVADGFHWFVFGFGDMDQLGEFFLSNFDSPMFSAVIALVVQNVYAWRVYRLSKLKLITGFICICAIVQAAGGLGIGIVHQQVGSVKKWQPQFTVLQIIWVVFSALADTTIAAAMIWLLVRSRTWQSGDERCNVLTKIVRLTIETNVASAAVAIAVLITTVAPGAAPPHGTYFFAPGYVLGKLYSNSFMAMLNNRTFLRQEIMRNQVIGASRQQGNPRTGEKKPPPFNLLSPAAFAVHISSTTTSTVDSKPNEDASQV